MIVSGLGYSSNRAHDVGFLKQYTPDLYRVVHMNSVLIPGMEARSDGSSDSQKERSPRRSGSDAEKLESSISRSKSKVFELAICNPWEYFVTLTLSPEKNERYNLEATYKRLSKWFNNLSRFGFQVKYLLVPEPHKDGAWHFHGLMMGIPPPRLTPFTLDDHIPNRIRKLLLCGRLIYNWQDYEKAFGYVTLEPVIHREHCAAYMTKYITKDLGQSSIKLNHHLFYASHGLNRAKLLYRGQITRELENPDFENDYVHVKSFTSLGEAISYFCDEGE